MALFVSQVDVPVTSSAAALNFEAFVFCVPDSLVDELPEETEVCLTLHKIRGVTIAQVGRSQRLRPIKTWAWRDIVDFEREEGDDEDMMDMFSLKVACGTAAGVPKPLWPAHLRLFLSSVSDSLSLSLSPSQRTF